MIAYFFLFYKNNRKNVKNEFTFCTIFVIIMTKKVETRSMYALSSNGGHHGGW